MKKAEFDKMDMGCTYDEFTNVYGNISKRDFLKLTRAETHDYNNCPDYALCN